MIKVHNSSLFINEDTYDYWNEDRQTLLQCAVITLICCISHNQQQSTIIGRKQKEI